MQQPFITSTTPNLLISSVVSHIDQAVHRIDLDETPKKEPKDRPADPKDHPRARSPRSSAHPPPNGG